MLIAKGAIERAIEEGEIVIDPFDPANLEPASYDARLGQEAIVTREVDLEELKEKVEMGSAERMDVEAETSVTIPAGGLALVTTLEQFSLSNEYAGHIGMKSYYVRKGIGLLSGLQIDPGFGKPAAVLVLALKNQSTRSITIDYRDEICSIEFHELNEPAPAYDNPGIERRQSDGAIPREDIDYLRTIEAMSISEMTEALLSLSRSVENNNRWLRRVLFPLAVTLFVAVLVLLVQAGVALA